MKHDEGADQLYEKIVQLKMRASDGKMRKTDAADMQGIIYNFRHLTTICYGKKTKNRYCGK